jgi:hypothetical protein
LPVRNRWLNVLESINKYRENMESKILNQLAVSLRFSGTIFILIGKKKTQNVSGVIKSIRTE